LSYRSAAKESVFLRCATTRSKPANSTAAPKEIIMRHRKGGFKLGRNTSHRRALLRNLVTSIVLNDRIQTTLTKAKASRPLVEKMITLGKNGSVHARRQALAYLMTPEAVDRLFATVAPRYATRNGGYSRILKLGTRQGDSAEIAIIELLDAQTELQAKADKREAARQRRREELAKQLSEESAVTEGGDPSAQG
jgi:large subunit ribosomal protein L17